MIRLGTSGARGRRSGNGGTVTLSLSHRELAQMTGMTRSHVTVTLGRLRRRGLVRYRREGPLRVDLPALTAYLAEHRTRLLVFVPEGRHLAAART